MISVTELRAGTTYEEDGQFFTVLSYEHIKMGRGSANIKVKVKNVKTGSIIDKSYINGAKIHDMPVLKKDMQYLYKDDEAVYFMDSQSYEQISIPLKIVPEHVYLKEGETFNVSFLDGEPLTVLLPPKMTFKVTETAPGAKGNSATNVFKEAILENGLKTKVPLFINTGEVIRVDTRTAHIRKKHNMNAHILRVFSERSFLFLWIGEVFTQVATNLFNFFLIFTVYNIAHSNTAVSGVVLSFTIPAIFFGSIAGAYVDRWNKKYVLIITNSIRALLLILLAFMLNNLFMIYVISLLISILFQFFIPAESPMVPTVVKKSLLLHANALFGLAIFGSILVAYVLSGPLLILLKPVENVLLYAAMLIIGAIFTSFIKPYDTKRAMQNRENLKKINVFKDIKQTLAYMRHTRAISHSLFLLSLSQILILILATIAPGYASQILGIPVEQFPIIFVTPAALGMVIGSIVLVNFFHNHPKEKLITIGIFLSGISMLLLPFGSRVASRDIVHDINFYLPHLFTITIFHIMVVLAFILGIANSLVFVPANTRLQEHTSEEIRGKIYGFLNTFIGLMSLIPIILVGGLSDLIGVGAVITGIGICLILFGFINIFIK